MSQKSSFYSIPSICFIGTDGEHEEFRGVGRVLDEAETCKAVLGPRGGGDPSPTADELTQGRDLESTLERGRPRRERAPAGGHRDRAADDFTVAGSSRGAGGGGARRRQPACHSRQGRGQGNAQPQRPVGTDLNARGVPGRVYPRLQTLVSHPRAGARRVPADDREAPGPHAGGDDHALCASGEGIGAPRRAGSRRASRATCCRNFRARPPSPVATERSVSDDLPERAGTGGGGSRPGIRRRARQGMGVADERGRSAGAIRGTNLLVRVRAATTVQDRLSLTVCAYRGSIKCLRGGNSE